MTIFFPDVSQYTPNVDVAPYEVVIARATLSDSVADPTYQAYKQRAAGKVFAAYHWLNHGNTAAQAKWCFDHVGPDVPLMIDAEDTASNTGYAGPLTIADITAFAADYRALGGIVGLVYLPFWYWNGPMGAPHQLDQLVPAQLGLVSSNYSAYGENGPGWSPYYAGAPAPVQWQYTSTPIDMNAFKGTAADFAAVVGHQQRGETMGVVLTVQLPSGPAPVGLADGFGGWRHIADVPAAVEAQAAFGARAVTVDMARRAYGVPIDDNGNVTPATPIDTHALATDVAQQLIAANTNGLTAADLSAVRAVVKAVLDAKLAAAQGA